ncbi:hypothetical protein CIHG_01663 [Coccidioides immitis H538.4]|uniref:Uncharacterized protein n=3 Tax=Coccidioides immitis TaxID=5501 RepID=A0A0J8R9K4_COCIT|nr:hypothetical protein CIRG_05992 [Coccidioides immitis RMSCC 2394]KMU80488.1 hypothetical protein CISG_02338 [Coccidioides immitis RMSCC 3703]KMU83878.1 hypothetical protein CIHG_01663 [Coccidioides immitis H538.4]
MDMLQQEHALGIVSSAERSFGRQKEGYHRKIAESSRMRIAKLIYVSRSGLLAVKCGLQNAKIWVTKLEKRGGERICFDSTHPPQTQLRDNSGILLSQLTFMNMAVMRTCRIYNIKHRVSRANLHIWGPYVRNLSIPSSDGTR